MIQLKNLRKGYKSGNNITLIVNASRLDIQAGERVAIVGESGSGKTTLLNLISGLVKADSGEIVINGNDICKLKEARRDRFRANNIGYLFQSFHLLDGYSAVENVELGMLFASGSSHRQRAIDELTQLGLAERLNHFPSQLSIGQQARVALARATVTRPKIILADEPTGALDEKNATEVAELLFAQSKQYNTTLVCATHDAKFASGFDRIINISDIQ
jgi:ABC-type lipoprotein export system ATPase subunit